MRFESDQDLIREIKAIQKFTSKFGMHYKKLGENDIDFGIYNKNGALVAYAEVKGRNKYIRDAFPLPLSARKAVKLADKKITAVIIWDCLDGIIYGKLDNITGEAKMGGRKPRKGAVNDIELMIYYHEPREFVTIP